MRPNPLHYAILTAAFLALLPARLAPARSPPGPSLAECFARAELVVVGELDDWAQRTVVPVKPGAKGPWAFRYATVELRISEVLKGPAGIKNVPVRFNTGWVDQPAKDDPPRAYTSCRCPGVWILGRDEGHYVGPRLELSSRDEVAALLSPTGRPGTRPALTTQPAADVVAVDALVLQLRDDDYRVREAATQRLHRVSPAAGGVSQRAWLGWPASSAAACCTCAA